MYFLKVAIAYPDYKRPWIKVIIEHFKTKELAEKYLHYLKKEYIKDFYIDKEMIGLERNENDTELISVDELDKIINNKKIYEIIYSDSYIDQNPFEFEIFEVKCKNESFEETVSFV